MNQYYNPVRTYEGFGAVRETGRALKESGFKDVLLLVWNESVFALEDISSLLNKNGYINFSKLVFEKSNPDIEDLFKLYEDTKNNKLDAVIAIGGGSVLDMGKSLCCLYGSNISSVDELREIIKEKSFKKPALKWIGVPTTAGTGSEVTCWATVWDKAKGSKLSLECHENYAEYAFVDPQFAQSMPVNLAVSSALDAAAHALESFWSKASNVVSRASALSAIGIIMDNISALIENPRDIDAHDCMAQGSMLAGLAFSNTKTTACHSISYPLTLNYGIPHGAAVSLLIAPVSRINEPTIKDFNLLLEAFRVSNIHELDKRIKNILNLAGIPARLKDWGVTEEGIDKLAEAALTKGRIDNNPIEITEEMIKGILKNIY